MNYYIHIAKQVTVITVLHHHHHLICYEIPKLFKRKKHDNELKNIRMGSPPVKPMLGSRSNISASKQQYIGRQRAKPYRTSHKLMFTIIFPFYDHVIQLCFQ